MIQRIKTLILALSLLITPAIYLAATSGAVSAATPDTTTIQGGVCGGADSLSLNSTAGNGCQLTDQTGGFNHTLTVIINIFSVIVGIIAVIMIIVAGFRYITSGGKQESVTGAKNTILYAIIGLIIVALAQVIVRFVLNKATSTT